MTRPLALIVGAGIAGLSAAWWLDKAGWDSIVIEKAASIREKGYIITLSGPGLDAIKHMNLLEELKAVAYAFNENVLKDGRGRELLRVRYTDIHRGLDSLALCRDDLVRSLAKALPDTASIRFGESLDRIQDKGNKIQATLLSGEIIEADLLIGADGVHSTVRKHIHDAPDCLEPLNYLYAVYDIDGSKDFESDCVSYSRPCHLDIFYALRHRRLAALHIWRDNRTGMERPQNKFEVLQEITAESPEQVRQIVDRAREADVSLLIDTLTVVNLPQWSAGRVLLLGDAAHCLTLFSGQGAGMALASAEVLGNELLKTSDTLHALRDHERKLRPVICRLQQRIRNLAAVYIPKNSMAFHFRNLILKFTPRSWIASYHANSVKSEIVLSQV